jgi:WD40 repeat protein
MFNIAGGTVEIWDTSSGAYSTIITHAGDIAAMHVTARGNVVSGGWDGNVFLFETDKKLTLPIGLHDRRVINVIATDDFVVSADADGFVKVWDININREAAVIERTAVTALEISGDSKAISGHIDGTVLEWDLKEGTVAVITKHHSAVTKILALENGDIATAGKDRTVRVWRAQERRHAILREHKRWVIDLRLKSADEIVSRDEIQTVITWNYKTGEFTKTGGRSEKGIPQSTLLPGPVMSLPYNERLLLEANPDGRVVLRDGETILAEYDFQSSISCVAAPETRRWIVIGLINGRTGWLTLEPTDASRPAPLLSAWREKVGC